MSGGGWRYIVGFNPLTGISSILTRPPAAICRGHDVCFNPLTGISSILTYLHYSSARPASRGFQSPDGDFVYSDETADPLVLLGPFCFNPLTGISSILTGSWPVIHSAICKFQSPDGDFVYSDPECLQG